MATEGLTSMGWDNEPVSFDASEKKAKKKKKKKSSKKSSRDSAAFSPTSFSVADFPSPDEFGAISGELVQKSQQDIERRKQKKSKKKSKREAQPKIVVQQQGGESTEQSNSLKFEAGGSGFLDAVIDPVKEEQSNRRLGLGAGAEDRKLSPTPIHAGGITEIGAAPQDDDEGEDAKNDERSIHSDDSSIFSSHPMSNKPAPTPPANTAAPTKFSWERSSMLEDTDSVVGGMMGRSDESVATFGVLMKQNGEADDEWDFPGATKMMALKQPPKEEPPLMIPMAISAKKKRPKRASVSSASTSRSSATQKAAGSKRPTTWDAFTQQNDEIHEHDAAFGAQDAFSGVSGKSGYSGYSRQSTASAGVASRQSGYSRESGAVSRSPSNGASSHYTGWGSRSSGGSAQVQGVMEAGGWSRSSGSSTPHVLSMPSAMEQKAAELEWSQQPPPAALLSANQRRTSIAASSITASEAPSMGEGATMADMLVSYLKSMGTSGRTAANIAASFREQQQQQGGAGGEGMPMGLPPGMMMPGAPPPAMAQSAPPLRQAAAAPPPSRNSEGGGRGGRRGQRSSRRSRRAGRGVSYERAQQPGAVPMEGRAFGAPRRPDQPQVAAIQEIGPDGTMSPIPPAGQEEPSHLVQATAVKDEPGAPIVYADSTPLSIRDLLKEKPIRRRLCFLAFIIVTSVTIAVSLVIVQGGKGSNADNSVSETLFPTAAPSMSPTYISSEVLQYALALSGRVVEDPESPQFKAVGWMSTFDAVVDGFGELFEQRYTMVTLFYSLNGDRWLEQDNWMDPDEHECDWSDAIFCRLDGTGRRLVNGLDLTRNGLQGPIPEELRYTPHLEFLRFSKNSINGTIPSSIFSLPNLAVVDLNNNEVTGSFPDNMGDERGLVFFDVSFNKLTGSFPSGFYELSVLRIIEAHNNMFSGTISTDISKLKVLSKLNLGSNRLSGSIPDFEGEEPPKFDLIDLSHNRLTGTIPPWFTSLLSRQELLINDNFITGSIPGASNAAISEFLANPDSLENVRLKKVDVSNNRLTGSLPAWGGLLPSLQFIDLSNNEFSGTMPLGDFLGTKLWQGLETWRVANNRLTGTVSSLLPEQIREVDLQGNAFTGTVPREIADLTSLQFLTLDNTNLGGEIGTILKNAVNLKTFSARNTSLTGSINGTDWLSLANCEILDLSMNRFQGTIPSEWGKLPSLKKLFLSSNEFTGRIPTQFGLLDDLIELKLDRNVFVGRIPSELGQLSSLENLTLADNNLLGKVPTELGLLGKLKLLTLSGNALLQGTVPVCNQGTNFSRSDIGCQLECSCCVDEPGACSENGEPSGAGDVFNENTRNLRLGAN